jgi:hypothetical protein
MKLQVLDEWDLYEACENRIACSILIGKLERTEDVEYIDESFKKYRNGP